MLGRNHYDNHRGTTTFIKSVATTVTLAFLMLILTPTVVAARDQYGRTQRWSEPPPTSEARLAQAADDVRVLLERLDGPLVRTEETGAERRELRRLPEAILQRHRAMVEHYRAEVASLLSDLDDIDQETDEQRRGERIKATQRKLESERFRCCPLAYPTGSWSAVPATASCPARYSRRSATPSVATCSAIPWTPSSSPGPSSTTNR